MKTYLTLVGIFWALGSLAQDVGIDMAATQPRYFSGQSGTFITKVCNNSTSLSVPAGKLRPLFTLAPNLPITTVTNLDGSPISDWTVNFIISGGFQVTNSRELLPSTCFSLLVTVLPTDQAGLSQYIGQLSFVGGKTPGNIDNNDVIMREVEVRPYVLPVKLISFKAENAENFVRLQWETSEEVNSERFILNEARMGNCGKR